MPPQIFDGGYFQEHLEIGMCPHCSTARPSLRMAIHHRMSTSQFVSRDYTGEHYSAWATFVCSVCGGAVLAVQELRTDGREGLYSVSSTKTYPAARTVASDIPERPRNYLSQAIHSLAQPDGAAMLAASAVDAMFKERGLKDGTLYARIQQARDGGLITPDMADWAHEVRLGANDSRHADEEHPHHAPADAKRLVEFATALAELLFVLPARIARGREATSKGKT